MTAKKAMLMWVGLLVVAPAIPARGQTDEQGWISLFDGKSLEGGRWRRRGCRARSPFGRGDCGAWAV